MKPPVKGKHWINVDYDQSERILEMLDHQNENGAKNVAPESFIRPKLPHLLLLQICTKKLQITSYNLLSPCQVIPRFSLSWKNRKLLWSQMQEKVYLLEMSAKSGAVDSYTNVKDVVDRAKGFQVFVNRPNEKQLFP